ncbi:MAG: nicotinamide-nucleotide amidohydrolase family protein [Candidatus Nanopelagicales bacterium]
MSGDGGGPSPEAVAAVAALQSAGVTVAVAESLTGGLVCAALTDVPGASAVVRGGVVAYATDLKAGLLGVDPALLARVGPVHPDVAVAMAVGVAGRTGADLGLACTGVAGPDPQGGREPGVVFVAAARASVAAPGDAEDVLVRELALPGDRAAVRTGTVRALLEWVPALVARR